MTGIFYPVFTKNHCVTTLVKSILSEKHVHLVKKKKTIAFWGNRPWRTLLFFGRKIHCHVPFVHSVTALGILQVAF